MKHMFGGNAWSTPKTGDVQGMGFRPGPVQVSVKPGHFQLGGSQLSRPLPFKSIGSSAQQQPQMEGECADGSCSMPKPSNVQANHVPMGKKTDCPVCRTFGGGKSGF